MCNWITGCLKHSDNRVHINTFTSFSAFSCTPRRQISWNLTFTTFSPRGLTSSPASSPFLWAIKRVSLARRLLSGGSFVCLARQWPLSVTPAEERRAVGPDKGGGRQSERKHWKFASTERWTLPVKHSSSYLMQTASFKEGVCACAPAHDHHPLS